MRHLDLLVLYVPRVDGHEFEQTLIGYVCEGILYESESGERYGLRVCRLLATRVSAAILPRANMPTPRIFLFCSEIDDVR